MPTKTRINNDRQSDYIPRYIRIEISHEDSNFSANVVYVPCFFKTNLIGMVNKINYKSNLSYLTVTLKKNNVDEL